MQRRRSVPHTFEENLSAEKARLEGQIAQLRRGPERDGLLQKVRQIETALNINKWLSSPGLRPPETASS